MRGIGVFGFYSTANEMKRTHIDFTADESWQKYVFWFAKIWHSLINSMHCIARKCKTRLIVKAFFLLERLLTGIFDTFLNYSTMQRRASKAQNYLSKVTVCIC